MRSRARSGDLISSFDTILKRKAENCAHKDRPHYADKLCRSCYDKKVYRAKKRGAVYGKKNKEQQTEPVLVERAGLLFSPEAAKAYDSLQETETDEEFDARMRLAAEKMKPKPKHAFEPYFGPSEEDME